MHEKVIGKKETRKKLSQKDKLGQKPKEHILRKEFLKKQKKIDKIGQMPKSSQKNVSGKRK